MMHFEFLMYKTNPFLVDVAATDNPNLVKMFSVT